MDTPTPENSSCFPVCLDQPAEGGTTAYAPDSLSVPGQSTKSVRSPQHRTCPCGRRRGPCYTTIKCPSAPGVMFTPGSPPADMPWTYDYRFSVISLTPLTGPLLIASDVQQAPQIPNTGQEPRQAIATARAVGVLVDRGEGGNTVLISLANQTQLRIYLFGIDLPDPPRRGAQGQLTGPGQPYSEKALGYLAQLARNQQMRVEIYGVDVHHRFLGTFFADGYNLNLALVEAGLAAVSRSTVPTDPYRAEYERAEAAARAIKRGMWALGDQYESPRDYRRRLRLPPSRP